MVDPINGVNAPNPFQNNRAQNKNETQRSENVRAGDPVDAVEISSEASDTQALQLARETRDILTEQREEALTRTGQKFDQLL